MSSTDSIPTETVRTHVVVAGDAGTRSAYDRLLGGSGDSWKVANARLRVGPDDVSSHVLFGTGDLGASARLLARRGVEVDESQTALRARAYPLGVVGPAAGSGEGNEKDAECTVGETGPSAIDHLVFFARDRDHAVAVFAGEFGLSFRLQQPVPGGGRGMQLFFRGHSVTVEVVVSAEAPEPITFWGIAWQVADLDAVVSGLVGRGVDVGPARSGRKPGTRVATVRDPALRVPTLLIEHS